MSPNTKEQVYNNGFYVRSLSGKGGQRAPFDMDTYMKTPARYLWVAACADIIGAMIASVPLKVYEKRGNEVVEVENSPITALFDNPNPEYSGYEFKYLLAIQLAILGNVFLYEYYPNRAAKIPESIYLLSPRLIKLIPDDVKRVKGYLFGVEGKEELFLPDEISHIRRPNLDSHLYGQSPLQALEISIATDMEAQRFNKAFFENNATLGAVIEQNDINGLETSELTQKQVDSTLEQFEKAKGAGNAFRMIALPKNCSYKALYESLHQDMQYIEGRKLTRQEVLSLMKIPPAIAGLIEGHSAYANIKEQHQIIWELCLKPLLRLFESVVNRDIIRPAFPNQFCKHDLSEVKPLQEDENSKVDRAIKAIANGIMTINEARESIGLDARSEAQADVLYLPFSLREVGADAYADLSQDNDQPTEQEQEKAIHNLQKTIRLQHWQKYYNRNKPYEDEVKTVVRQLFEADKQYFLNKVKGMDQKALSASMRCARSKYIHARPDLKKQIDRFISKQYEPIDDEKKKRIADWTNKLVSGVLEKIYRDNYQDLASLVDEVGVARFVSTRKNMIVGVVEDTFKTIMGVVEEGLLNGLSVDEISSEISTKMDGMKDYRAKRIARTETGTAANQGHFDAAVQQEFEYKTWNSVKDSHARDTHASLDGEKVGINERFSNGLRHPNDPTAEAGEIINCRCTVMYE